MLIFFFLILKQLFKNCFHCFFLPKVSGNYYSKMGIWSETKSNLIRETDKNHFHLLPQISGVILMVALSCVGNLLFVQSSWAFSSLSRSLQTLLCRCWGLRTTRGLFLSGHDFLYRGVLHLSSVVWTAVVHINHISHLFFLSLILSVRNNMVTDVL